MEFTYINTIDTKFAFLTSNRNISTNKDLVESIKEKIIDLVKRIENKEDINIKTFSDIL